MYNTNLDNNDIVIFICSFGKYLKELIDIGTISMFMNSFAIS